MFHVGRLDRDSEGLLLLTNDGDFSLRLTHPRYKVEKEYEVILDRPFDMALARNCWQACSSRSIHRSTARHRNASARGRKRFIGSARTKLKVILRQGLKRQIRLMLLAVGYEVKRLQRVRMGNLKLGKLRPGEWRYLEDREVAALRGEEKKASAQARGDGRRGR